MTKFVHYPTRKQKYHGSFGGRLCSTGQGGELEHFQLAASITQCSFPTFLPPQCYERGSDLTNKLLSMTGEHCLLLVRVCGLTLACSSDMGMLSMRCACRGPLPTLTCKKMCVCPLFPATGHFQYLDMTSPLQSYLCPAGSAPDSQVGLYELSALCTRVCMCLCLCSCVRACK